ncbi:F-box-like domain-containing protein [Microdochium nivale]|nr:F-box-like domain-containing protein [Microdochium nivale]
MDLSHHFNSLHITRDPASLESLPADILLIILSHLHTAQSLARLGSTCRVLHNVVITVGWRTFVRSCFPTLDLPHVPTDAAWRNLARSLTCQSRDWDRRAFVFDNFVRTTPQTDNRRGGRRGGARGGPGFVPSQTIPCHLVVAAHETQQGGRNVETVVWGAGEDVVARTRLNHPSRERVETWHLSEGARHGHTAGKDDITCLAVVQDIAGTSEANGIAAVTGRASGELSLISLNEKSFAQPMLRFRPSELDSPPERESDELEQRNIQALDTANHGCLLASATRDTIMLYSYGEQLDKDATDDEQKHSAGIPIIEPYDSMKLRHQDGSRPFQVVRDVKFVGHDLLAVGLTSSLDPLRYITIRPSGLDVAAVTKVTGGYIKDELENGTVRAILPVGSNSMGSGFGSTILSAWDDGTIRLQDIRTKQPFDRIYQDHFEPTTPTSSLISFGLERFVAGSARASVLKIFDFRWSKGYQYTNALSCSDDPPYPESRSPTMTATPYQPSTERCDYLIGSRCCWHALSSHAFYRPNINVYLNVRRESPIHTLARASDTSSTLYAGLSATLVEMNLKGDQLHTTSTTAAVTSNLSQPLGGIATVIPGPPPPKSGPLYPASRVGAGIIETGDGSVLRDVSESQRVPLIRHQHAQQSVYMEFPSEAARKRHRLDACYQYIEDFTIY